MPMTLRIVFILLLFITTGMQSKYPKEGEASYYADKFEGRPTASGEPYRADQLTAAHRTLPFGTRVKVTNLSNDRSVVVRINDRGPHVRRRIIDLSRAAAEELDFIRQGVAQVSIQVMEE